MKEVRITHARKIYEILDLIHRKPYLNLSSKSITALQDFLNGYLAVGRYEEMYNEGEPDFKEFLYSIGTLHGFAKELLTQNENDESKAFYHFFELLDKYKNNTYYKK